MLLSLIGLAAQAQQPKFLGERHYLQADGLPFVGLACPEVGAAAAGDLNGDGRADVAISCTNGVDQNTPYIAVYLNQGNGTVQPGFRR